MPELGPYGSVRGARGNSRPYRDPRPIADIGCLFLLWCTTQPIQHRRYGTVLTVGLRAATADRSASNRGKRWAGGLRFEDANDMLRPGYLPFESGYQELEDGKWVVAGLTRMPGCRAKMVDWWFSWLGDISWYRLWHPTDHVYSGWENRVDGKYIGASRVVTNISPARTAPFTSYVWTFTTPPRRSTASGIVRPERSRSAHGQGSWKRHSMSDACVISCVIPIMDARCARVFGSA